MSDGPCDRADRALGAIALRYGIGYGDLHPIGHAGSDIREFWRHGRRYVLRLSRCKETTLDLLRAEIHWISYLNANGVSASAALPSKTGALIEETQVGGTRFAAVVFQAAEGRQPVDFVEEWDAVFYHQWGSLVGRMHGLAKTYSPPEEQYRRPHWYETDDICVDRYVPRSEKLVTARCHRLFDELKRLPVDSESYGLIHADLHRRNFFVKDGVLTVIDFGSCQYGWFAYDIAVCLYHASLSPPGGMDREDFGRYFLRELMVGYREANSIEDQWLDRIPLFLKLRRIVMYVDAVRYWDLDHLTKRREQILAEYRTAIESDTPVLNL